uniref:Uncharacterized protein n=1 Tax=Arundo donax TaxID=35708 RepID=A0A0A9BIT9_ARUDO
MFDYSYPECTITLTQNVQYINLPYHILHLFVHNFTYEASDI